MKKILFLLFASGVIVAGCYANCVHNNATVTNPEGVHISKPAGYKCYVSKHDTSSFTRSANADGSHSYTCNGCGCDRGLHDAKSD